MCCLTHWFSKLLNLTIRSEMTVLLALYFLCTNRKQTRLFLLRHLCFKACFPSSIRDFFLQFASNFLFWRFFLFLQAYLFNSHNENRSKHANSYLHKLPFWPWNLILLWQWSSQIFLRFMLKFRCYRNKWKMAFFVMSNEWNLFKNFMELCCDSRWEYFER